ncbi:MAG TPA: hypothetical protein VG204_19400 [Terriglobia bacterium]|nr:hypothetical protein [Terriglobia bacterium]
MPQIEECFVERAPELARELRNLWGRSFGPAVREMQAGNSAFFTALNSSVLLDKAIRYLSVKELADNQRQFNRLSERDAAEETAALQAFAEEYMRNTNQQPKKR